MVAEPRQQAAADACPVNELEVIANRSIKQAVMTQSVALILSPLLTGGKVF